MNLSSTFLNHFENIEDPRRDDYNLQHDFTDVLIIAILATICGADGWTEIEQFGIAKYEWLKTFLSLPNGIPSHDTFGRVFAALDPEKFEACFHAWIDSLDIDTLNEIIAIDGKSLRGSGNKRKNKNVLHLVSAWAAENRIMLGQVKTSEKSNEIEAIPRLLNMLDIKGSIVTIDAMGCQKNIALQIVEQGANYVLALKENQPSLHQDIKSIFALGEYSQFKKMLNKRKVEKVHDHGRTETRRYTLISARDPMLFQIRWPGMKSIGMVEVTRTTNNEVERSKRFFVTSLDEDIDGFMRAVRKHWSIEINLHWSLDVSFREDHNRARAGYSAQNLATVRRIALNLLTQEKTHKRGIACKRKTAGWNHQYLLKVLDVGNNRIIKNT
jgi:predicted transposase YbfD/YdcC